MNRTLIAAAATIAMAAAFSGCNDYSTSGTLDVASSLNIGSSVVPAGNYSADFAYSLQDEKVHITIHPNAQANPAAKGDLVFAFHVPKGLDLDNPQPLSLKSADIGEPEDMNAQMHVHTSQTATACSTSSCERSICKSVCDADGKNCKTTCTYFPGEEEVCSHIDTTDRDITLEFLAPNTSNVVATLDSSSSDSNTVIDSDTGCR